MKANPNYWGGKPKIDEVVFRLFNNADAMVAALKKGEIDAAHDIPANAVKDLRTTPGIVVVQGEQGGFTEIAVNGGQGLKKGHPALSDIRVRQAIAHAIDKQTLIDKVSVGLARAGTTISPSPNPKWIPEIPAGRGARLRSREGERAPRRRRYKDTNGDGIREMPGGGEPLKLDLHRPLRVRDGGAERGVRHRLAEGDRDRHDDQDRQRLQADGDDRQGRLRPLRVGLDAVRRPRSGALVLHVQPAEQGSREPDELLQRRELVHQDLRRRLQGAERRARPAEAASRSCTGCCARCTARRSTTSISYDPDLQAYRTDRFTGWVRQPAGTGPVLFSNTSPTYALLTPVAASTDGGGGSRPARSSGSRSPPSSSSAGSSAFSSRRRERRRARVGARRAACAADGRCSDRT